MKINRNNYELFFMDYLDGNLSDRDIRMLENFLLINPDLRTELEGTEKIILSPEPIVFDQKDFLIKSDLSLPVNESNFEDFCIAATENDLNDYQLSELNKYSRENPSSEKWMVFFSRLHLSPDKNIVFKGKEKLRKSVILRSRNILYPVLSIAATVAFMLFLYLYNETNSGIIEDIAVDQAKSGLPDHPFQTRVQDLKKSEINNKKPEIEEASVIAFNYPKEKKNSRVFKAKESLEKKNNENKNKENLPPQRLNPSFQIKLPAVTDNQTTLPAIESAKISYDPVKVSNKTSGYLSLSEYARKQLAEKVLGNKNIPDSHISAWQIADAGITGINKITGGAMKLEKKIGNNGNITAYSFNSKLLSFSTTAVK